jgi:hypothetical protein
MYRRNDTTGDAMTDDTIQTVATHTIRPETVSAIRAAIAAHVQLRTQYADVSETSRVLLLDGLIHSTLPVDW